MVNILPAGCTLNLTSTLTVPSGVTVTVNGNNAILDGQNTVRVLEIAEEATVTLNSLVIRKGLATPITGATLDGEYGGGIWNAGELTLSNSVVHSSSAGAGGGGIALDGVGTLTLSNSILHSNTALSGGGIINAGSLSISGGALSGNNADQSGGALASTGGSTTTVTGTNFYNNNAGVNGHAIFEDGVAVIACSRIVNNTGPGTDVYENGGELTVELNWWGAAAGPNTAGAETTNVPVSDWLNAANAPCEPPPACPTQAELQAALNAGGVIDIQPQDCLFNLTSTLIVPDGVTVTVNGNGAILDGQDTVRVLWVEAGATATLNNLTIRNGRATGISGVTISGEHGGGIFNAGTLTINNSTVQNNTASANGGAIVVDEIGTLTINNSTISNNTTGDGGGGIYSYMGVVTINNSSLDNNTSLGSNTGGGAIFNFLGMVTVNNSTFTDNSADSLDTDYGGGAILNIGDIFYMDPDGDEVGLFVSGSTFTSNSGSNGGAIYTTGISAMAISGSTFTGNSAAQYGGGVFGFYDTTSSIINSDFYNNSAGVNGSVIAQAGMVYIGCSRFEGNIGPGVDLYFVDETFDPYVPDYYYETTGLIAEDNWWGAATGPNTAGAETTNVPVSTWLAASDAPCANPAPVCPTQAALQTAINAGGVINILPAGCKIQLTSPLNVPNGVMVTVNGYAAVLDGQNSTRALVVEAGATATFSYLRIVNGAALTPLLGGLHGGGIVNAGDLTINTGTLSNNTADRGGAIYNAGDLTILNLSHILTNTATEFGGGIYNAGALLAPGLPNVFMNTAQSGGGIYNTGVLTMNRGSFENNSADDFGGGIHNADGSTSTVNGTYFMGNSAGVQGSVVYEEGTGNIVCSYFYFNSTSGIDLYFAGGSGSLTAEHNWWGAAAGPNTSGAATTNVPVSEWLNTSSAPCEPPPPPACPTQAELQAALNAGGVVNIQPAGCTLNLTSTLIVPDGVTVTVHGNGAILDGQNSVRVMEISENAVVTLNHITVRNGHTATTVGPDGRHLGGGIWNTGSLTVNNSSFTGNTAQGGSFLIAGGAIAVGETGVLVVNNSSFDGNNAVGSGGAIYSDQGLVTISGSSFTNNSAQGTGEGSVGSGGAIHNHQGGLTISGSSFSDNNSESADISGGGGAILHNGDLLFIDPGADKIHLVITDSSFTNNSAVNGGAIAANGFVMVTVHIRDSSFTGNSAVEYGGAIFNPYSTSATIINSDFYNNSAGIRGSVMLEGPGGVSYIGCSRFAGNTGPAADLYFVDEDFTYPILFEAYYYETTGLIAEDNWWGAATGPNTPGAQTANVPVSTWLNAVDAPCVDPAPVCPTQAALQTAINAGGVIDILPAGCRIQLTSPLNVPNGVNVTINGYGLVLDAESGGRAIVVNAGATATFNYLRIVNGAALTPLLGGLYGGGIVNAGDLTLNGNVMFNNTADQGGAIYNTGDLTMINDNNGVYNTAQLGGMIYNSGMLDMTGTHLYYNNLAASGGVIYNAGALTLEGNTSFWYNQADEYGGAVYSSTGSTTGISGPTFLGNSAGTNGSVIHDGGTGSITCSSFEFNWTPGIDVYFAGGGGSLTVENNWWGAATGPNTSFAGTTNVPVSAWLTDPDDPCPP